VLTAKQEKFVQNIIDGMSQADAYRSAYDTKRMSDKTVWESASKLMATPKVTARLAELRERMVDKSIMTAKQRLEFLTNVVNGEEDINAKLKAIDIMNKMQGEYVQKVEADVKNEVTINVELIDE
jgi:phage terminase small subunit